MKLNEAKFSINLDYLCSSGQGGVTIVLVENVNESRSAMF